MSTKSIKCFFLLIPIIAVINCSQKSAIYKDAVNPDLPVVQQIEYLVDNPSLDPATIGIYVEELGTGKVVYKKNEHKLLMPASNMKLVTTASALSLLGPDFQYKTEIYTDGKIENGVLKGNLVIKGSGDPVICGRWLDGKIDSIFVQWSEKLKELGINKIDGKIIGDNSLYTDDLTGYGWEKEDLVYYYGAGTSALSFNDNCIDLHISPADNIGEPVEIKQVPVDNYLEIVNQMITVPADSSYSSSYYRNFVDGKLYVRGQMPQGHETDIDWTPAPNPADFFIKALGQVMDQEDISFTDKKVCYEKQNYENMKLLFTHKSVPMKDIVHNINKISNNYYAETVQKTLCRDNEITTKKAIKAEKEFLASIGIDTDRMFIVDGSGLSRHNMVTVYQISTILKYMISSKNAEHYKSSLPVCGVDGTMKRRLKGSNAKGHVFAKTGYVGHVRALSGYVEAKNGKTYVFSIIANHYPVPTSQINNLQDQIVTILYNQK